MKPVGSGAQKPGYTISQAFGNQGLDIDSGFRKPEMATLNCLPTALPRMMVLGQESAGTEGMREIHASGLNTPLAAGVLGQSRRNGGNLMSF